MLSATMQPESFLSRVAVIILTYNEAPNIRRTLAALSAFPEVIILDSGSTDETLAIAAQFPNVRVQVRSFDQHAAQWNYALKQCGVAREWILALDADYVLSPALVNEIAALKGNEGGAPIAGYRASFRYFVHGHMLRGTLYPPSVVLYRRASAIYIQEGHTQRLVLPGRVATLSNPMFHDDRKPLVRWLASQHKYAELEAAHLLGKERDQRRWLDRIRLMALPAPPLVFFYALLWKRCILDGWPGWFYALQRTYAEVLLALGILDRRLRSQSRDGAS